MEVSKRSTLCSAILIALASIPCARADIVNIVSDTYIDSYNAVNQAPLLDSTRLAFGRSGAIKAVTSAGSTQYPFANSLVHGLFTLPDEFWTKLGTAQVASAVVSFRTRNIASIGTRLVELHPLLQSYSYAGVGGNAGVGGEPGLTQGGWSNQGISDLNITTPTSSPPFGPDWLTYDGVNPWSTPGAPFDASNFVTHTQRTVSPTLVYFDWNIASLINNPTTRAEIQANGLLFSMSNELNFPAINTQNFVSLWTSDGATNPASLTPNAQPTITFFVVPEPASAFVLLLTAPLLLRRRR